MHRVIGTAFLVLLAVGVVTSCGSENMTPPPARSTQSGDAAETQGTTEVPDSTSPPVENGSDLPSCGEVWRPAAILPAGYAGCESAGGAVEVEWTRCPGGGRYASYDGFLHAAELGPVFSGPEGLDYVLAHCGGCPEDAEHVACRFPLPPAARRSGDITDATTLAA